MEAYRRAGESCAYARKRSACLSSLGSGKRVETNHGGASKRSAELGADHVDFGRGVKEDKAKAERRSRRRGCAIAS
jgi:hypothetical protein